MNCSVGGTKIKSLARAIQALSKIGDDLFIESSSKGLQFSGINSSRSAYVWFLFKPEFFADFTIKGDDISKCKVSTKSCIIPFRSFLMMEKTVEVCLLDTSTVDCTLLVQFSCKHDLKKIYHLPFIEDERIDLQLKKDSCTCKLTAKTRVLLDGIQNFSNAVQEVTLIVSSSQVILKNYVEDEENHNKVVHTELTLEPQEFEEYVVTNDLSVTFCLKELKVVLGFAENFHTSVTISCQCSGKPIIFSFDRIPELESEFVLATLADRETHVSSTPVEGSFLSSSRDDSRIHTKATTSRIKRGSKSTGKKTTLMADTNITSNETRNEDRVSVTNNEAAGKMPTNVRFTSLEQELENDDCDFLAFEENMDFEANNKEMDEIPSTPPKKRFKIDFLGLSSQASQYISTLPETNEVLVEESEEDD